MEDVIVFEEEPNQEGSAEFVKSDSEGASVETPNGVKPDADEAQPPEEKSDTKEKSGVRRGNRFHPYKDKNGAEKKGAQRNRVFISNIPYDMKWQAIKDLMREKGNGWCLWARAELLTS